MLHFNLLLCTVLYAYLSVGTARKKCYAYSFDASEKQKIMLFEVQEKGPIQLCNVLEERAGKLQKASSRLLQLGSRETDSTYNNPRTCNRASRTGIFFLRLQSYETWRENHFS